MGITLLAVVVGLIAGFVAGGGHAHLGGFRVRGALLPLLWAGLHVTAERAPISHHFAVMVVADVCALIFVVLNLRRARGIWLLGLGIGLNLAVFAVNGAMPYRTDAVHAAGIGNPSLDLEPRVTAVSRPERPGDRLVALGDVIPVSAGPLHEVLSIGDLLVALGSGLVVFQALQPREARTRRRDRTAALIDVVPEPPAPVRPTLRHEPQELDDVTDFDDLDLDDDLDDDPDQLIDLTTSPGSTTRARSLDLLLLHARFDRDRADEPDEDDALVGDAFWSARQELLDRHRP